MFNKINKSVTIKLTQSFMLLNELKSVEVTVILWYVILSYNILKFSF